MNSVTKVVADASTYQSMVTLYVPVAGIVKSPFDGLKVTPCPAAFSFQSVFLMNDGQLGAANGSQPPPPPPVKLLAVSVVNE